MAMPCKKAGTVRNSKGVCTKPSARAAQPDVWTFSAGRWRKVSKPVKVSKSAAMGCPPGTRYSPRVKDETKRCVAVSRHEGPRKPRTNCKYGFSEATGRCAQKPKAARVLKVKAPKPVSPKASDPAYTLNQATGRYVLKVRKAPVRKAPAHPCPEGQRYYAKAKACKDVKQGPKQARCPKGKKRSAKTGECYSPVPRFMRAMGL
jgi:hypothetical protein